MREEIIEFQIKDFLNIMKNKSKENQELILIGKYVKTNSENEMILGYLEDINMLMITLIKGEEKNIQLEAENIYRITGKLKEFPDNYSNKLKLYIQLEVNKVEKLEKSTYPVEIKNISERKRKLLNREKEDILNIIINKVKAKEVLNFLYIVSEKYKTNNEEKDILNDLYFFKKEKEILENEFNLTFDGENNVENIIRVKFTKENFFKEKNTLNKIRLKIENGNYDGIVFIKGGGSDLKLFDNIEFCESISNLNKPFITAIGHTDDNELLLAQIADKNYSTPTRLGVEFFRLASKIYFANQKDKNLEADKIKLKDSISKIEKLNSEKKELEINLEKEKNKVKDKKDEINRLETNKNNLEKELNKLRFKNIISLFIIVILLGYSIFSIFFMKREVKEKVETTKLEEVSKEKNTKLEENKKDEKNNVTKNTLKENLDNLKEKIIATEKKNSNNNQKNISIKKVENKGKKLVYSEDYLYTVLSWKGYRGERAIQEFQKANGMKVTGKVDENLLKKLGIKVEYK